MRTEVIGNTMPVLEVWLSPGETVLSESGRLAWIDQNIELATAMGGVAGSNGVFGALKRAVGGSTLFMTEYSTQAPDSFMSFAATLPGQIIQLEVAPGNDLMVHRGGFLCGHGALELSVGIQKKLGAGIFGGAGVVMQKVSGQGTAWLELGGEIRAYELAAGQSFRVHPGHLGAFEQSVSLNFASIKGIKNKFFGGGLFLAELHGPGKIWLQSLSVPHLADALAPYLASDAAAAGAAGGFAVNLGNNN